MSLEDDKGYQAWLEWFKNQPNCDICGETITGSHYHCSCGTADVTGMYGHHSSFCRVSGGKTEFHHCGPNGDCELSK